MASRRVMIMQRDEIGAFYLPPEDWEEPFRLKGPECAHLIKVLRARPGDEVRLLDGKGREGRFSIAEVTGREAILRPEQIIEHPRPKGGAILALGWAKSLRRSWLLEKAVELEAREIWFWRAKRSQAALPEESKESWRAQLVAGAKQCGNPWLPEIRVLPGGIGELLEAAKSFKYRFMLHEDHERGRILALEDLPRAESPLFILGPEGGFAPEEAEALARADIMALSLGKRILRWETAALLCLGLSWWNAQRNDV